MDNGQRCHVQEWSFEGHQKYCSCIRDLLILRGVWALGRGAGFHCCSCLLLAYSYLVVEGKIVDTFFVGLSVSLQVWMYSPVVAMSLLSSPCTACQSPLAYWHTWNLHWHACWVIFRRNRAALAPCTRRFPTQSKLNTSSRVAVVALIDICSNVAQGRPREVTWHTPLITEV